ncbi:hypothetical protein MMC22_010668 [Lobaria immixta]|nr:hypothetical protein [Lobaria immixta]
MVNKLRITGRGLYFASEKELAELYNIEGRILFLMLQRSKHGVNSPGFPPQQALSSTGLSSWASGTTHTLLVLEWKKVARTVEGKKPSRGGGGAGGFQQQK